ncbi:MAG: glutaredoxin 3 [Wenzhouxiangella sp.]|jgi:glutaredoxin 3|nr:glutaredoxin 3 [Wenzhouxiangella sp.]MDR9452328.1 glutaredoxin 3 [Wenzhouxiangella sp.]
MDHNKIMMYGTRSCPFCVAARSLLQSKGADWDEVLIDDHPERRAEMIDKTQRHTVPQIFIGEQHVGGFDDLQALDQAGRLDPLLSL